MTDLSPTPDAPGIRIYAPSPYRYHDDPARWSNRNGDTPNASYACGCGETANATGRNNVAALVDQYTNHKNTCGGRR
ncbi:hypothetical protein [Streptomyces sp. NPDC126933]|uniref:hypothetical protein n=1 Tax=unclassified Streptomyces TaxID=2593676 RepID=UPI00364EE1F2